MYKNAKLQRMKGRITSGQSDARIASAFRSFMGGGTVS